MLVPGIDCEEIVPIRGRGGGCFLVYLTWSSLLLDGLFMESVHFHVGVDILIVDLGNIASLSAALSFTSSLPSISMEKPLRL